jgi:hypothetical protein
MKNKFLVLMFMLSFFLVLGTSQVWADILVIDDDGPDSFYTHPENPSNLYSPDTNPQSFSPTDPADEQRWLAALLGYDPGAYIAKDASDTTGDEYTGTWAFAVLKYGVGKPSITNPDHWAVFNDDGDQSFPALDLPGMPDTGLSHVTYFGGTSVPEPQTMLLLGTGLIGLAAFGRKKIRKN